MDLGSPGMRRMLSLYGEPLSRDGRPVTREKRATSAELRPARAQRLAKTGGRFLLPKHQHFSSAKLRHGRNRGKTNQVNIDERRELSTNVPKDKKKLGVASKEHQVLEKGTPRERRKEETKSKRDRRELDKDAAEEGRRADESSAGEKRKPTVDSSTYERRAHRGLTRERRSPKIDEQKDRRGQDAKRSEKRRGAGKDLSDSRTPLVPVQAKYQHKLVSKPSHHQEKANADSSHGPKEPMKKLQQSRGELGIVPSKDRKVRPPESPRAINYVNNFSTSLLDGRWKVLQRFGIGNFGEVYEAVNVYTREKAAVKIASTIQSIKLLGIEYEVYKYLNQSGRVNCIPYCGYYGPWGGGTALVLDLLGKSLHQLKNDHGGTLSLKTVFFIGMKVVKCIEDLHETGILHRDIKPDNILTGRSDRGSFYLVDFGLAGSYRSLQNGRHISKPGSSAGFVGTARYASLNVHDGIVPTRRDDLISLGYSLVYLYKGSLPWQNTNETNPDREVKIMGKEKRRYSFDRLCSGMGERMVEYFQHLRDLPFAHKPDYGYLVYLLTSAFVEADFADDLRLDWNP